MGSGIYINVDPFTLHCGTHSHEKPFRICGKSGRCFVFSKSPIRFNFHSSVRWGLCFFFLSSGPGLQLDPLVLSGLALIFGTMPPKLALTVGIDVSGLAARLSRAVVAQRIMNRFLAFKIAAIQFVATVAKITFCNLADRQSVMRCENITIDDVVCPVRGGGPRPQNIFVYNYPYEGDELFLRTVLSEFGDVQDVRFRHWLDIPGVCDGVRVASMIWKKSIPRHLTVYGFFCKITFYGQPLKCDICNKTGHIARECPLKGKCRRCLQAGHLERDCPDKQTPVPPVVAVGDLAPQASQSESSDSSSTTSNSGSSSDDSVSSVLNMDVENVDDVNSNESSSDASNVTQQKSGDSSNVTQKESGVNIVTVAQQKSGDLSNVTQHQSGEQNVTVAQHKSGDLPNSNMDQGIINLNVAQQESGDLFNDSIVAQQKSGDLSFGNIEHHLSNSSVAQQKSGDLINDNIEQNVVSLSVTQQKSGDLFNEQNTVNLNATQEKSGDLSNDNCSSLAQQLVGEMFEEESQPSADDVILSDTSPFGGDSPALFSEGVDIPWADRVEEEEVDKERSSFGKIRASRPSRSRSTASSIPVHVPRKGRL